MMSSRTVTAIVTVLLCTFPLAAQVKDSSPPRVVSLGALVRDSSEIVVLEVVRADRKETEITYRLVENLKGSLAIKQLSHSLYSLWYGEVDDVYLWARPGRRAVAFCQAGTAQYVCTGNFWYSLSVSDTRTGRLYADEAMPQFARCFVGPVESLREGIKSLVAGKEIVITAETTSGQDLLAAKPQYRDWVHGQKGRVCRIKARIPPKPKREAFYYSAGEFQQELVGWGVCGEEGVFQLRRKLKDKDPIVRAEAAEDLGWLKAAGRRAEPELITALRDDDPYVRLNAAGVLAALNPKKEPDLKPMLEVLKLPDARVRSCAAMTLADLGSAARDAIPALTTALSDSDRGVRAASAYAIGRIGFTSELSTDSRLVVIKALGQQMHVHKEPYWAIHACLRLGSDAWPLVRTIVSDSRECDTDVAAEFLVRLEPPPVSILASMLTEREDPFDRPIPWRIGELGSRAWLAVPALEARLSTAENELSLLGVEGALIRIDPRRAVDTALPRIARRFERPDHFPDLDAIEQLSSLARSSKKVVGLLRTIMKSDCIESRKAAITLGCLGHTQDALDYFLPTLKDQGERISAATALGQVGPGVKEAIPALKLLLRDVDEDDRPDVRLALRCIEGGTLGSVLLSLRDAVQMVDELAENQQRFTLFHSLSDEVLCECYQFGEAAQDLMKQIADDGAPKAFLLRSLKSERVDIRHAAAIALCRMGEKTAALPVLLQSIEEKPFLLVTAAGTLAFLGPDARPAIPLLSKALHHETHLIYREARRALRAIDPEAISRAWGIRRVAGLRRAELSPREHEECWEQLASSDAAIAYQAVWRLALDGKPAESFLAERLRQATKLDDERIGIWLADLDSRHFAVRRRAEVRLKGLGPSGELEFQKALRGEMSLEKRRRLEQLLETCDPQRSLTALREIRAIDVLEQIATPSALAVLKSLPAGPSESLRTKHIRDSVTRLEQQGRSVRQSE
jgi:HEAT repeat protein